jgi:hypothetical protein
MCVSLSNVFKLSLKLCVCVYYYVRTSINRAHQHLLTTTPPSSSLDNGLNLSILISPGKENNCDALSNGERSGQSSNMEGSSQGEPLLFWVQNEHCHRVPSALERDATEGDSPVCARWRCSRLCLTSSVPCEWSVKRQVIP